jgi:hypothetical protein
MTQIFFISVRTESSEKTAYLIASDDTDESMFWDYVESYWPEFCRAAMDLEVYWCITDNIPKGAKVFSAFDLDEDVGGYLLEPSSRPFFYSVFIDEHCMGHWTPKSGLHETDSFFEEFPSLAPYKEVIGFMEVYGYEGCSVDEDTIREKLEKSMRVVYFRKGVKTSTLCQSLDEAFFKALRGDLGTPVTVYNRKGKVVMTATFH